LEKGNFPSSFIASHSVMSQNPAKRLTVFSFLFAQGAGCVFQVRRSGQARGAHVDGFGEIELTV
jgi:hypothetical protein